MFLFKSYVHNDLEEEKVQVGQNSLNQIQKMLVNNMKFIFRTNKNTLGNAFDELYATFIKYFRLVNITNMSTVADHFEF